MYFLQLFFIKNPFYTWMGNLRWQNPASTLYSARGWHLQPLSRRNRKGKHLKLSFSIYTAWLAVWRGEWGGKGDSDLRPLSAISSIALWRETGGRMEGGFWFRGKGISLLPSLPSPFPPLLKIGFELSFGRKGEVESISRLKWQKNWSFFPL